MTFSPDYTKITAVWQIWPLVAAQYDQIVALNSPHSKPEILLSYQELADKIQQFAAGLQALGVAKGDKLALIADNSPRWLIADQGIMTTGAANAVRSSLAETAEILYILEDSDSSALVVEDQKTLNKLEAGLSSLPLKFIVLLSEETPNPESPTPTYNFAQILERGKQHPWQVVEQEEESLATLIYTSGTTGQPKGVMLSHRNLLHQVRNLDTIIQPQPQDTVLSILPSWHSYERSAEYFLLSRACTMIYTNIRSFKADLKRFAPQHIVAVPRLWESIYEGVQKQFQEQPPSKQKLINFFLKVSADYVLANRIANNLSLDHLQATSTERLQARLKASLLYPLHWLGDRLVYQTIRQGVGGKIQTLVSGGGSLAKHLDDFYEIVNLPLLVGYGLTETSPVTNARTHQRNLKGSAGRPLPETEIRIVNPDSRETLPSGQRGLVLIRGTQVMNGYYKKPEATAKAIDPQGWFDSGDLGWMTPQGDLVLTGRAKDTIVLTNGENIEPQPIEDACTRSPYISQIMLVGQDQKALGALIVPNLETLEQWGKDKNLGLPWPQLGDSPDAIAQTALGTKPVQELLRMELNREVKNRPGYRPDDQIKTFRLILEPFSLDNGMMTQTLKIKRPVVTARYQAIINEMFTQ
jgi:long-chain acyl-CoA synthetase